MKICIIFIQACYSSVTLRRSLILSQVHCIIRVDLVFYILCKHLRLLTWLYIVVRTVLGNSQQTFVMILMT